MTLRTVLVLLAVIAFAVPLQSVAATTVTSSVLDHIVIVPNDRPTVVDVGTDQQFLATGFTKENQTLSGITFTWSSDGKVGTVNRDGIFTGKKGGIGRVTARSGSVTASVGVVVHGVAAAQTPAKTAVIPPSSTTVQPVVTNTNTSAPTNTNTDQGTVKGATTENTAKPAASTKSCTTIRAWLWVLILLLYCIVLFAYFLSLGESRTMWWWVWPAIITAAPYVLYFLTRCGTTHLWVPWTLGVLAVLLGLFYVRVLRPTESLHTQQHP